MKRLFLITLLCFLAFCSITDARMLQGVAGATTACTTSNYSKLWNPVTQPGTTQSGIVMKAIKFTTALSKDITAYKIRECENSGNNTGNGIARIITHDSGNDWPSLSGSTPVAVPNSSSNTFPTSSMSDCATTQVDEYTLASTLTLAAGTYWLLLESQGTVAIDGLYAASTGDRVCYKGAADTSWTCVDNTMYDMELWGCD